MKESEAREGFTDFNNNMSFKQGSSSRRWIRFKPVDISYLHRTWSAVRVWRSPGGMDGMEQDFRDLIRWSVRLLGVSLDVSDFAQVCF